MLNSTEKKPRLVVLISGSGTNLQAFIDWVNSNQLPASLAAVISNKPDVKGLDRASKAGIPTAIVDHRNFDSRESFDQELLSVVDQYEPDLIILAGFMRILTPEFVDHYAGRLINIHPSLLPKYPGLNTHQRAIDANDDVAGATVHFVTTELDGGPSIIQAQVPIENDDTAESLAARVLLVEHQIYPLAAKWFCEGRLQMNGRVVFLDGKSLPSQGYYFN